MSTPTSAPGILLCATAPAVLEDVRALLESAGQQTAFQEPTSDERIDTTSCRLVILEASGSEAETRHICRRLRGRLGDAFVPILFVTRDHGPAARLAGLEGGADTYLLRPFAPGEVLAQINAFLRIKDLHDRLTEKTAEVHLVNKRLQQAYQQIDKELELARRLQRSFLPQTLPEVPGVRFAVHYRLHGQVGGDFYDVFRLDESHVGLYVADAVGHGVPASLLTIFVKKGVQAKEISGKSYKLVPPGEVLQRLNRDLIEQRLSEMPFITMAYALLNYRERTLRFARAGHPYPLYLPREGQPILWQMPGSLMGVFDAVFPSQTYQLHVGDKVLFYSDGIDGARADGQPPGSDSLLACAARLRELPIQDFVNRLAGDLFGETGPQDDLTLLGLEVQNS